MNGTGQQGGRNTGKAEDEDIGEKKETPDWAILKRRSRVTNSRKKRAITVKMKGDNCSC